MIVLAVLLRDNPIITQYYFDQFKDADAVLKRYHTKEDEAAKGDKGEGVYNEDASPFFIEDDYGQKAFMGLNEIAVISLSDMDKEMEAKEKIEWAKVQVNIRLQKKLQENPAARLLVPQQGLRQ